MASGNGDSEQKAQSAQPETPDLVGEELGDGARIWREYDRAARADDQERISNWNRGLDNLALFAGLFSAVTTAFIIEVQSGTEPDYARLTYLVLNATAAGVPFREERFEIEHSVRVVNCLWISSLMLSLTAALIAIMGKDWIAMYGSRPICNPRQWAELRTYRLVCVERWYMSGVIASAPVLLHLSLALFAVGLVIFLSPDPISQRLALGLSIAAGLLYGVTALSAVVFSSSPFRSPATQVARNSISALFSSLRGALTYGREQNPVAQLQHATLILGALIGYPVPVAADVTAFNRRRQQHPLGDDMRVRAVHFPSYRSPGFRSQLRTALAPGAVRETLSAFVASPPARVQSARIVFHDRFQRTRTRSWYPSLPLSFETNDLSDPWSSVNTEPNPGLLAKSISLLNEMSLSPEMFHSILVALGDLAIGPAVAPLVSLDLNSRLRSKIHQNSPKANLETLARYVLVDQNLSPQSPLIQRAQAQQRFDIVLHHPSLRSEHALFAVAKLNAPGKSNPHWRLSSHLVAAHCPDVGTQPRALQYMLHLLHGGDGHAADTIVVLANRYWHHLEGDRDFDLEAELRRNLWGWQEFDYRVQLANCFGGRSGLIEILVYLLIAGSLPPDAMKAACELILKVLASTPGRREHPALAYAFGSEHAPVFRTAWEECAMSPIDLANLASALPLVHHRYPARTVLPDAEHRPAFESAVARAVVVLLSPARSQDWNSSRHWLPSGDGSSYICNLELCVRALHAQLCNPRSVLDDDAKLGIISSVLETSALVRVCAYWELSAFLEPEARSERLVINILTAIARRLQRMMGTPDTFDEGARLFYLFSFAEATNEEGDAVEWDLGAYVRFASDRLWEHDPAEVAMRRLVSALYALRSFVEDSDDLRAAWNRIELPTDGKEYVSFSCATSSMSAASGKRVSR